jgi:hypothetical protein
MITARMYPAGLGTNSAALAVGGYIGQPSFSNVACVEGYNGTSWSTRPSLIAATARKAGAGCCTAAITFGGLSCVGGANCSEAFNGTSWSTFTALINGRYQLGGSGTNTSALAYGGINALTCTESYNGSSWSASCTLNSCRNTHAGAGINNTSALAFGGYGCGRLSSVESFSVGQPITVCSL